MFNDNKGIDRRIRKSKKALKDSLLMIMEKKDFREITITDIVKSADLHRGTFYNNYQFKEDLLREVVEDVIQDLIISYRQPYHNSETFKVKDLTSSAIKIFEHVATHATFYKLIVSSSVLIDFQKRICNELKKLTLQDLISSQPNPKINLEMHASYQAYAIVGMIVEWINDDFKYSSHYMSEQLLQIIHNQPINTTFKTNNLQGNKG